MEVATDAKTALVNKLKTLVLYEDAVAELDSKLKTERQAILDKHYAEREGDYRRLDEYRDAVDALRRAVRQLALEVYEDEGSKRPVPGVSIRSVRKLDYSDADAIRWAIKIGKETEFLAPKKRPLEKALRAIEPDFVTITVENQVAIAQDLKKVLGGEQ